LVFANGSFLREMAWISNAEGVNAEITSYCAIFHPIKRFNANAVAVRQQL
jgi:hypothetical protein